MTQVGSVQLCGKEKRNMERQGTFLNNAVIGRALQHLIKTVTSTACFSMLAYLFVSWPCSDNSAPPRTKRNKPSAQIKFDSWEIETRYTICLLRIHFKGFPVLLNKSRH